ncbi:hypothetical protein CsatB_010287 [Cannabis sativa]
MTCIRNKSLPIQFGVVFLCFFHFSPGVSLTLQEQEQSALLKLKQQWGNLPYMSQWIPSKNSSSHCSWPGITCMLDSVTELKLYDVNITVPVPFFICDLSNLSLITLGLNYIPGEFPTALFNCSKLEELDLSDNYFVGTIPSDIDRMVHLRSLKLGGNNFTGNIPIAIGRLQELRTLELGANQFNGSLPLELGNLSNLETLWLSNNKLLSPSKLPSNYTQLKKLKNLWLTNLNLIGKIPESIGDMVALEFLDLSRNSLIGNIPDGLFTLKNLSTVYLYKNILSGEIPQVVESLKLKVIDFSENNLTGIIPEDFGKLKQMTGLALFINQLSGNIPEGIGRLPALIDFRVFNNNLSGVLPSDFGKTSKLQSFRVNSNRLTGTLPEPLGNCSSLLVFNVGNNMLSGEIPSGLWTLPNLGTLILRNNSFTGLFPEKLSDNIWEFHISNNRFSGTLPTAVSSWRNLIEFEASDNLLTGNMFSGQIPSQLGHLSMLQTFNLSSNKLTGIVPPEFYKPAFAESFLDNPNLCASNNVLKLKLCDTKSKKLEKILKKIIRGKYLAVLITLTVAVFLSVLFILFFIIRCYSRKNRFNSKWKVVSFQRLNFRQTKIVSGIKEHNLIGTGGSSKVYRVRVSRHGDVFAVKSICNKNKLDHNLEQEFLAEVKILTSIRHSNIVKLIGCISSESSTLLVYEYMENRSLDRWLYSKNREITSPVPGSVTVHHLVLDWPKRLKIAIGAAQGICYMHHDCVPPVIHRDIKSSNILLDSDFNPKIADFGVAKCLARQGELATMSTVAGSFGYIAPEYSYTTRVNEKIDVYSFGIVLLELATGREANDSGDTHSSLVEWAWRHVHEDKPIAEALDEEIREACYVEEMCCVFKIGIKCTQTQPSLRPSMKEVVKLLLKRTPTLVLE